MRALVVVNPKATTTSERGRDVLVRALGSAVELDVAHTRHRGHAADLGRQAAADGYDVVVTLGGDGTINEVINGLLAGPAPAPALAVVPGGSTNVFAGALGLPRDWAEGTAVIIDALRNGRTRTIGLGRADDRYFTFCAGFGLDAEVVRRVESARMRGRSATPALYLRSTLAQYFIGSDRRHPPITLERPGAEPEPDLAMVIVQNTSPWTYLGEKEIHCCPRASFDTGLDLMAMRALRLPSTIRTATQMLRGKAQPHGRRVLGLHDLDEFTLRSERPLAFQLDGDYLGERDRVTFTAVPDALRIVG